MKTRYDTRNLPIGRLSLPLLGAAVNERAPKRLTNRVLDKILIIVMLLVLVFLAAVCQRASMSISTNKYHHQCSLSTSVTSLYGGSNYPCLLHPWQSGKWGINPSIFANFSQILDQLNHDLSGHICASCFWHQIFSFFYCFN